MSGKAWYESFFEDDYLEIYENILPAERTAAEVEGIISPLDLAAGARVLNLACGHRRHAISLSKRRYDVTGYNLSEVFLERARVETNAQGTNVRRSATASPRLFLDFRELMCWVFLHG